MMIKKIFYSIILLLLTGCQSFSGLRTPTFSGEPMEMNEEKIAAYQNSQEIIGVEKELYIPEPFSPEILEPSLEFPGYEPVLLEEGYYVIGEDLPPGRVTIFGQTYDPHYFVMTEEKPQIEPLFSAATLWVRDAAGTLYFENMFHPVYGNSDTQVDFRDGHTIEIQGVNAALAVFYEPELPEDPYILDPRKVKHAEEFENAEVSWTSEAILTPIPMPERSKPIEIYEEEKIVEMTAGIYEVGVDFEPGTYRIFNQFASHPTQIYLFSGDNNPRVFEITNYSMHDNQESFESSIDLQVGDKIYPYYVMNLILKRVDEN